MDWDMKIPSKIFKAHENISRSFKKLDLALKNEKNIQKIQKKSKTFYQCLNMFENFNTIKI